MELEDRLVELLDKVHGFQVARVAVLVRLPLAVLPAVVQVEHVGDGVDAQPVDVVLLEPEHGVRDEEALHFRPTVVEVRRAPLPVLGALLVVRFVERHAVEVAKPLLVLAEVARHPVHDDGDAVRMCRVDEVAEVIRLAIAARDRVVPRRLIAPRTVERMLAERHDLDVRIVHLLRVADELVGKFAIRQIAAFKRAPPRAEMNLVRQHGAGIRRMRLLALLPCGIVPLIFLHVVKARRRLGLLLCVEAVRIGLHDVRAAPLRLDRILVDLAFFKSLDERHPDLAVTDLFHRVRARVPRIEVADDAHGLRMGRPDGKAHAFFAVLLHEVGAEHLVSVVVGPLVV